MKYLKSLSIKDCLFHIIWLVIIALSIYPTLKITGYTYPVQDDFYLTTCMRELNAQGYGIISGAWYYVVDYYKSFMGAYSAVFLVFIFEAIVDCSQPAIMIFESCSLLLFYFSLLLWVYALAKRIFGLPAKSILGIYACLLTFVNNVFYYSDHEDYYWLDTSILYLGILSLSLMSIFALAMLINGTDNKKKYYFFLVLSCVLSFIASGANLALSFMNCSLHVITLGLIWYVYKRVKPYCGPLAFALLGTFINGIAPGNYIRKGESGGLGEVIASCGYSFKYIWDRVLIYAKTPVFVVSLAILIIIVLSFCKTEGDDGICCQMPLVLLGVCIILQAAVAFPGVIGYSYEVLGICMRLMFIIDCMIYMCIVILVIYICKWISFKIGKERLKKLNTCFIIISIITGSVLLFGLKDDNKWRYTPVIRMYREINNGRYKEYSEYVWNIYDTLKNSNEMVVTISCKELEDKSCLVNPSFCFGDHGDEAEYYYDDTIVNYYGKEALYLYDVDEE